MEKQEIWKPVIGYEGLYEVSNLGRVKSLNYNHTGNEGILKTIGTTGHYQQVNLWKNRTDSWPLVHRLVWCSFNQCDIPEGYQIDHIDGNPSNNCFENLRCVTPKENLENPITIQRLKETREKMYNAEWRRKVTEGCRMRSNSQEWKKNSADAIRKRCCKPVDQYTLDGQFVKRWSSATDAAREIGGSQANISACCRGKHDKAYGFIWKFAV